MGIEPATFLVPQSDVTRYNLSQCIRSFSLFMVFSVISWDALVLCVPACTSLVAVRVAVHDGGRKYGSQRLLLKMQFPELEAQRLRRSPIRIFFPLATGSPSSGSRVTSITG
jgi:hypothetical protein